MLGAMVGIREGTHFVVDLWPPLNPRRRRRSGLVASVFVLVFAFVFLWWGIDFTRFAFNRISEPRRAAALVHPPAVAAGRRHLDPVPRRADVGRTASPRARLPPPRRRPADEVPGRIRDRRDRPRPGHGEHHHVRGVLRAARAARAGGVRARPRLPADLPHRRPSHAAEPVQETFNAYNSFILLAVPFFLLTANL